MKDYDGRFEINGQEYFYKAKDDSGSARIIRLKHEEHHYRIVEIINKETQMSDVIMINTGDSFTLFPDVIKNQYKNFLDSK